MLPIKKIIIERFVFALLLLIICFITAKKVRTIDEYHSSLAGIVDNVRYNPRDATYINIQFENTQEINMLAGIKNPILAKNNNLLIKGDSIFKPMFSNNYFIFRKINGKYLYVYKINSLDQ